jgi:hypothetical protein
LQAAHGARVGAIASVDRMDLKLWLVLLLVALQGCNCGEVSASPDAGDAGSLDAGVDAGAPDAGAPDAGTPDGGASRVLFAHLGGRLVRVDPVTGSLTEVGPTGQTYLALAWDQPAGVTRAIVGNFSPPGGAPTPRLGTIDLCTGALDAGPAITINGTQVRRAEALATNPDGGAAVITVGTSGTGAATQFVSESNGTVDLVTGAVTVRGNHQTLQDDGDGLLFAGGQLYLHDVATDLGQGALYRLDPLTGAATKFVDLGAKVLRITNDPSRGVLFVAYGETNGTGRGIGTLDLDAGVFTKLGPDLADGSYPGASFTMLQALPSPSCP